MPFLGRFRGQGARLIWAQSSVAQGWEVTKPCAAGRMNSWRDIREPSVSASSLASARYIRYMHAQAATEASLGTAPSTNYLQHRGQLDASRTAGFAPDMAPLLSSLVGPRPTVLATVEVEDDINVKGVVQEQPQQLGHDGDLCIRIRRCHRSNGRVEVRRYQQSTGRVWSPATDPRDHIREISIGHSEASNEV